MDYPVSRSSHEVVPRLRKTRVQGISRLSSMIVDIIDLGTDDLTKRWREQASDVLECFFSALWSSQDVRVVAEGLKAALLPTHLSSISAFWNESLPRSTVPNRLKSITFLLQLHPHIPRWQRNPLSCVSTSSVNALHSTFVGLPLRSLARHGIPTVLRYHAHAEPDKLDRIAAARESEARMRWMADLKRSPSRRPYSLHCS
jgi:hypothetical protein